MGSVGCLVVTGLSCRPLAAGLGQHCSCHKRLKISKNEKHLDSQRSVGKVLNSIKNNSVLYFLQLNNSKYIVMNAAYQLY